jgi:hypothetical protein
VIQDPWSRKAERLVKGLPVRLAAKFRAPPTFSTPQRQVRSCGVHRHNSVLQVVGGAIGLELDDPAWSI